MVNAYYIWMLEQRSLYHTHDATTSHSPRHLTQNNTSISLEPNSCSFFHYARSYWPLNPYNPFMTYSEENVSNFSTYIYISRPENHIRWTEQEWVFDSKRRIYYLTVLHKVQNINIIYSHYVTTVCHGSIHKNIDQQR